MNKVINFFTKFVNISLRILLVPVLYVCFLLLRKYVRNTSIDLSLLLIFFAFLCFSALYLGIKKGFKQSNILLIIIIVALVLRIGYVLSINNQPTSDFSIVYDSAEELLNGNYSSFKGSGYIARFPHLTILTLYYAFVRNFFAYPLIVIKVINSIFSTFDVILIYYITKECFNYSKKCLWAALITTLYPPLVVYPAAYNTENIAIPFFLASIYMFILVINNRKNAKWLLLCGFLLTIGNLFRMVGQVMIIAFFMFIFIYLRKSFLEKGKNAIYILGSFFIPLMLLSNLLIMTGITQFQLWKGSEPFWTSVLKGTNIESHGRWNHEDAIVPDTYNFEYDKVAAACKAIIRERLTSTPIKDLGKFYLRKFTYQWREGDFSASYWAQRNTDPQNIMINLEDNAPIYSQLFFFVLMLLSYIGLYNKDQYLKNNVINLFYIIFCGYALLYLITESQDRYSFIVCWLFVILALTPDWKLIKIKIFKNKVIIDPTDGKYIGS